MEGRWWEQHFLLAWWLDRAGTIWQTTAEEERTASQLLEQMKEAHIIREGTWTWTWPRSNDLQATEIADQINYANENTICWQSNSQFLRSEGWSDLRQKKPRVEWQHGTWFQARIPQISILHVYGNKGRSEKLFCRGSRFQKSRGVGGWTEELHQTKRSWKGRGIEAPTCRFAWITYIYVISKEGNDCAFQKRQQIELPIAEKFVVKRKLGSLCRIEHKMAMCPLANSPSLRELI